MGGIIKTSTFLILEGDAPLEHMHNGYIIKLFSLMAEPGNDITFSNSHEACISY